MTKVHARRKPHDAQRTYGILVGTVVEGRLSHDGLSPHYEIRVEAGGDFRVAVNVRSVDGSEVLVHHDPDFTAPAELDLPGIASGAPGFRPVATGPEGAGLDYLRDGLFDVEAMRPMPEEGEGSLQALLDGQVERAKTEGATVIVFGEFFQDATEDKYFGFSPERGVHDVHMMQGNPPAANGEGRDFTDDNRVRGDGALFIRFGEAETAALFIRFSTQATPTDDATGWPA